MSLVCRWRRALCSKAQMTTNAPAFLGAFFELARGIPAAI
jgi:hypothetical protein